jgi:formylglycine-generating enzyme required for sulfatase activity
MVVVPAGRFDMGSPPDEKDRANNEGPQHGVTFAKPFAIGKYEVTFDEWKACVDGGGCKTFTSGDAGDDEGRGRRPVTNVTWDDAKAYVAWLSKKTGNDYRLPSEAEWEYAARAGRSGPYWWGDTIAPEQANYNDGRSTPSSGDQLTSYRVVGVNPLKLKANPFFLAKVSGTIPPGSIVSGTGQFALGWTSWTQVNYGDLTGWVNTQFLQRSPTANLRSWSTPPSR